ncbi:TolC family protein [Neiella marina]|uniref:TolC family protein n=1 Tax=Neiella holothuriorum TaxID=2870530 RepID=A0ABS7EBN4_9GAMM|nr:TolC family protein [Neiella holothuriorum]MBW8189739.1 TolC family protein [Neiella holothuriorum]
MTHSLPNKARRPRRSAVLLPLSLCISLSLLGCTTTSELDFNQQAEQQLKTQERWQQQQVGASTAQQITDLIELQPLTELVTQAMANNPNLQQTVIALKIAYAQHAATVGDSRPQVNAGFSGERAEDADDSYSADLTVSWELDLWQKLSDNASAAEMDIASSQASVQAAKDALAASIMRNWLQINYLKQRLVVESQRLKTLEDNEAFIVQRYRVGLGDLETLDTAKSSSASARATLANYQEQLAQAQRSLTLLLGAEQPQAIEVDAGFPDVIQPLSTLPEQDLARRPDLQNAYYSIVAEQYRTDVAYKALLPSFNLSASLTEVASNPSDALFKSPAWSLLGQITAPLFQGGTLRAQAEIAELTAEQAFWGYQETLLNAVYEVENALGQEHSLSRQQEHLTVSLHSAERSFDNYQVKYRQGLVDILDLLTVQQQTFDLEAQLIETTYNRLVNRIDLGLALGLGVSS